MRFPIDSKAKATAVHFIFSDARFTSGLLTTHRLHPGQPPEREQSG